MNNMKLHFDLPQEDELGTSLLSGLRVSPYSSLIFMKDEMEYRISEFPGLGFDGAEGDE